MKEWSIFYYILYTFIIFKQTISSIDETSVDELAKLLYASSIESCDSDCEEWNDQSDSGSFSSEKSEIDCEMDNECEPEDPIPFHQSDITPAVTSTLSNYNYYTSMWIEYQQFNGM